MESILAQHEAQLAQLRTAEIAWSVKYHTQDGAAFHFNVADDYGVTGIPTCLIVDQSGQIVYRGNAMTDLPISKIEQWLAAA